MGLTEWVAACLGATPGARLSVARDTVERHVSREAACAPPPTAHSPRPTAHGPRPTAHGSRSTAHGSRPTVHSPARPFLGGSDFLLLLMVLQTRLSFM